MFEWYQTWEWWSVHVISSNLLSLGIDTDTKKLRKDHKSQSERKLTEVSENNQAGIYMYMIS